MTNSVRNSDEADEHLVRRRLAGAERLPQDAEHDHDARERRSSSAGWPAAASAPSSAAGSAASACRSGRRPARSARVSAGMPGSRARTARAAASMQQRASDERRRALHLPRLFMSSDLKVGTLGTSSAADGRRLRARRARSSTCSVLTRPGATPSRICVVPHANQHRALFLAERQIREHVERARRSACRSRACGAAARRRAKITASTSASARVTWPRLPTPEGATVLHRGRAPRTAAWPSARMRRERPRCSAAQDEGESASSTSACGCARRG